MISNINMHQLKDIAFDIIVACSFLHTVLPPWDFLNDFPRVQKVYKVFIYLIGYIGINARSTVYQAISVNNPNGVNSSNGGHS